MTGKRKRSKSPAKRTPSPKKSKALTESESPLANIETKDITVDEAALYDRQIRLWGLKTQKSYEGYLAFLSSLMIKIGYETQRFYWRG